MKLEEIFWTVTHNYQQQCWKITTTNKNVENSHHGL